MADPVRDSQDRWRQARGFLNGRRHALARAAQELYPASWRVAGTPMLARREWLPATPIPLDHVALGWRPAAGPRDSAAPVVNGAAVNAAVVNGTEPETAAVRPLREDGTRFGCYAGALGALSRPGLFENRACYRVIEATTSADAAGLMFGRGRYFEMINTCEAAAHEFAAAALAGGHADGPPTPAGLPFRTLIGDPTDLRRRPAMAATCTLVLRAGGGPADARMILHWRDPARVASGGGLYQVAPVGIFQPSDDAPWNEANDFSLWRCIVRELAEELLGATEDYQSDAAPIDYDRWPLYATLAGARRAGTLRVYWLGLGADPLTLALDLLSVAVFDAPLFDAVFAGLISANAEGRIVTAQDATGATLGLPFTAASVDRFTTAEPMQPAGAALLRLAWQHRATLLP